MIRQLNRGLLQKTEDPNQQTSELNDVHPHAILVVLCRAKADMGLFPPGLGKYSAPQGPAGCAPGASLLPLANTAYYGDEKTNSGLTKVPPNSGGETPSMMGRLLDVS